MTDAPDVGTEGFYLTSEDDAMTYPLFMGEDGESFHAVVTAVAEDGSMDLNVFVHGGHCQGVNGKTAGTGPGQWSKVRTNGLLGPH